MTAAAATAELRRPGLVLITGASGFIGRHLCKSFIAQGDDVIGPTRGPNAIPVPGVRTALTPAAFSIATRFARRSRVDAVVHLAGRVHANRKAEGTTRSPNAAASTSRAPGQCSWKNPSPPE